MNIATQLTAEAQAAIEEAAEVVYNVSSEATIARIKELNPNARSLTHLYQAGLDRQVTYEAMAEECLLPARNGRDVCCVVDGHPGVAVWPTHIAIERAQAQGIATRVLPGISSLDVLFADLAIDPFWGSGFQCYESGFFLEFRPSVAFEATLVLLQPFFALVHDGRMPNDDSPFRRLIENLRYCFGPDRSAVLYTAAYGDHDAEAILFQLGASTLPEPDAPVPPTLCIPPAWWKPETSELLR